METVLPLVGLALVDSLSVGTLVIPLGLLVTWRGMRIAPYATYLGTVAVVYFAIGVALLLGFTAVADGAAEIGRQDWFRWVTLVVGVALAAFGILAPSPKKPSPGDTTPVARAESVERARVGTVGMIGLALGACVVEAATMLPYLGAMSIIQSTDTSLAVKVLGIAAYCLVMIVPAVVVGLLALTVGDRVLHRAERAVPRLKYEAKVTLLWIAAIVGIHLAARSALDLDLIG